jgi:hypothetical protein
MATAAALYSAYDKNEVAADDKIGKSLVQISGVIEGIDKDFADHAVLRLTTSETTLPMGVALDDSQKARAATLEKGQAIAVLCDSVKRVLSTPYASGCSIVR